MMWFFMITESRNGKFRTGILDFKQSGHTGGKIHLRQTVEEVCCKESRTVTDSSVYRISVNVLLDKRIDNRHAP
jgi:hypothetical protein